MACAEFYLPIPPRAWYRVANRCPYDVTSVTDYSQAALINKGNILQYKKNSTQLTKKQRYSQIAKGLWTNRTKSWATQTVTYSNPNTSSLKRVGYTEYPSIPNNATDPFNCPNATFKDGGNLVCGTYQNQCTGEAIDKTIVENYYPTSDSDVPGPIQDLYWNPRIQTWYPKVRRIMNNSSDKWPVNYKLFVSAVHEKSTNMLL